MSFAPALVLRRRTLSLAVATACLVGCTVGPDYVRPPMDAPTAFKEYAGWKSAQPQAVDPSRPWWEQYQDPVLSQLINDADKANQNIRLAEANYRQALALVASARSGLYPTVSANAGVSRGLSNSSGVKEGNDFTTYLSGSWVPDFWGAVRRGIEANTDTAQASADDLANAHLSIQSAVASNYFQLRFIDQQRDLYAATTDAYARALKLTQAQRAAGVALQYDVQLAQSQLSSAQATAADLDASRAVFEHAIAILTGRAPADFSLASSKEAPHLPPPPLAVPSELLERRPDIAGAERRAAAANANIGVARAAYYPNIVLSVADGYNTAGLGTLLNTPSRIWSLGATLAQTLFDGGLRRARDDQAVAAYDATVATYKQTVLTGFQQVEDNLATLRVLEGELGFQDQAVKAGREAERLSLAQYRGGTATYLSVVTAQTLSLTNQRTAVQLRSRQFVASVALVTATGGGWSVNKPAPSPTANAASATDATTASNIPAGTPATSATPDT